MSEPIKILLLEDQPTDAALVKRELQKHIPAVDVKRVETRDQYVKELEQYAPDAVLADYSLPSFDAISALEIALEKHPELPFIIVSGSIGEERAVEALKKGAWDYILKDRLPRLGPAVQRVLTEARLRAERVQADNQVKIQHAILNGIINSTDWPIFALDKEYRYLCSNEKHREVMKSLYGQDIVAGRSLFEYQTGDEDNRKARQNFDRALKGEHVLQESYSGDGKKARAYFEVDHNPIREASGNVIGVSVIARDITQRKETEEKDRVSLADRGHLLDLAERSRLAQLNVIEDLKETEDQIKASLKEKEVMLKEIHHRVKNNLQIIASLLNLQTGYVDDPHYKKMFMESQNRVRSMALVHEKLYKSKDLSGIDFSDYVEGLMYDLYQAYGITQGQVALSLDITGEKLPLDIAIPCGLIVNELATNSLKYAFKDSKGKDRIGISFIKDDAGTFTLEVSDNGPGISKDLDLKTVPTLGLQLVDSLVGQLDASIKISGKGGTRVTIKFKAQS